ncbi:MAG TPA: thiolase family protein, partial [Sphingomonas sp.]
MTACIVGIGIHPFGRSDGWTGLDMGVSALRAALSDAGVGWNEVQVAYGGSDASGNADTMVNRLGLTGIPFVNVKNGCATGGSALFGVATAIEAGTFDLGIAVGFDKHPRGAFDPRPAEWGLPDWYGETGLMLTTQFFATKIQRYMFEHGISATTLGRVAEKSFRNGALAPHAWRREAVDLETILGSQMVSDPLTKYMFCSPAEGAVALVLASEARARRMTRRFI